MAGPPLRLMVDPNAKPITCHTPIPVPVHWQDEVKAGLKQDVRLGVIDTVPIGTPVTWCHNMVICPKKSGKPRQSTSNHWTATPQEKPTTPSHPSTKLEWSLQTLAKWYSTPGIAITAWPSMKTTATSQLSSHRGAIPITVSHHRAT